MIDNEPHSHLPVFGICGYSGAGKTTLIEKLIIHYTGLSYRICVVKHDVHGLNIDTPGKDSDRFFQAGADVFMRGPKQCVLRSHMAEELSLMEVVRSTVANFDIVLLEGHKSTPYFDKIWLKKDDADECPEETRHIQRVFGRDENRFELTREFLDQWLPNVLQRTPRYLGVVLPTVPLSLDEQEKLADTLKGVTRSFSKTVLLGSAPEFTGLRDFPIIAPIPLLYPVLGAATAARRWAPLMAWIFVTAEALLEDGSRVETLMNTSLSNKAVPTKCFEPPCLIDFRTQLLPNTE